MTASADLSPFGTHAPGGLDRALVLGPTLRDAPPALLPGLILIEGTSGSWRTDLFALLAQHGYTAFARGRRNVALRRG